MSETPGGVLTIKPIIMNYSRLMEHDPFIYLTFTNSLGQEIDLVEHPLQGDMTEVIAVCHAIKKADYTDFFETGEIDEVGGDYEVSFDSEGKLQHRYQLK